MPSNDLSESIPSISVQELKLKLDSGASLVILDVREVEEHEIVSLPSARLVPLMQIESQLDQLRDLARTCDDFVVMCRSGARSANATEYLLANGVTNAKNLNGGILAYAREIDPALPTY